MISRLTPRLDRAIVTAARLHADQKRKDGETPYIAHLVAVAFMLAVHTDDEDIIIAGLMHDALEDVEGYEKEDLARDFGERVAGIVEGVTHDPLHRVSYDMKGKVWEIRRQLAVEKLQAAPVESVMVKVADVTHNIRTMMEGYKRHGADYLQVFKEPLAEKMKRAEVVAALARKRMSHPIVTELEEAISEANAVFAPFL